MCVINAKTIALALVGFFLAGVRPAYCFDSEPRGFDRFGLDSRVAQAVQAKKRWGFIDKTGKFVIAPQFDLVKKYKENKALVGKDEKFYFIDKSGKRSGPTMDHVHAKHLDDERRWAKDAADKVKYSEGKYSGDIFDQSGKVFIAKASEVQLEDFYEEMAVCKVTKTLIANHEKELRDESIPPEDIENNLCGYIDKLGRMVIKPHFYRAYNFKDGRAQAERWLTSHQPDASSRSYIDKTGNLIGGKYYDSVWDFENGYFQFSRKDLKSGETLWGFVRSDGKEIGGNFLRALDYSENLAAVKMDNGLWGYIDGDGNVAIPPRYEVGGSFSDGLACVKIGGRCGYINKSGAFAIKPNFLDADGFSDGLAPVAQAISEREKLKTLADNADWHCGFINHFGTVVIPAHYYGARPFSEGLAAVREGLKWGFVDTSGRRVIKAQFDDARPFSEGLAAVLVDRKWGYIDKRGKMIIKPTIRLERQDFPSSETEALQFSEGLALAADSRDHLHFIDKYGQNAFGELSVDKTEGMSSQFSQGLAAVCKDPNVDFKIGFLSKSGKFQIEPRFCEAKPFTAGLAAVQAYPDNRPLVIQVDPLKFDSLPKQENPSYGFITSQGKFVVAPQYDEVKSFSEGLAAVAKGVRYTKMPNGPEPPVQKWKFIDNKGNTVIEKNFVDAQQFSEGLAAVKIANKWGFITKSGKLVIKARFDEVKNFSEGLVVVALKDKSAVINKFGHTIIAPKHVSLAPYTNGLALMAVPTKMDDGQYVDAISDIALVLKAGGSYDASDWAGNCGGCACDR